LSRNIACGIVGPSRSEDKSINGIGTRNVDLTHPPNILSCLTCELEFSNVFVRTLLTSLRHFVI